MSGGDHRKPGDHNRQYLTGLLGELRERLYELERKQVRNITAPVTDVDTAASTFSVQMPSQQDGTVEVIGGIDSPPQFLPNVGDSVTLQMLGPVPTYQPVRVADGAVGNDQLDPAIPQTITDLGTTVALKNHNYRQPNQPTGTINIGDTWTDTDGGNAEYVYGPVTSIYRQNLALNPSFEADAVGTVTAVSSWTNYTSGSPGTLTISVSSTVGVADKTKAARVVSASMPATSNTAMGFQQSYTAVPGDVFRISCVVTLQKDDVNKIPEMLVEWLTAANAVISSATVAGSGVLTAQQTLIHTGSALPATTASVRLTIRRRANGTGGALVNADLSVDEVLVEKNRQNQANINYFDGDTRPNNDSLWDTPASAPNSTSSYWQDATPGTNDWYPVKVRTDAIEPGSLVGHGVLAAQTVTAQLLEAVMVLASIVIAGDPAGDHATMQADGFHIFQNTTDGNSQEVGRLATNSNDFLTVVDSTGKLVASIDSTGQVSATSLVVKNDPTIQGTSLFQAMNRASGSGGLDTPNPGAANWYGYADGTVANVDTNEIGLVELPVYLDSTRMYMVWAEIAWHPQGIPCSLFMRVRDGGTSAPLMTSPTVLYRQHTGVTLNFDEVSQSGGIWQPSTSGLHRLLLTAQAYSGGSGLVVTDGSGQPAIVVQDLGPARALNATINHATGGGGAGAPVPTQQYYTELSPVSVVSRRGDGSLRVDTTDVVQGWDPSGFNGDGYGYWGFSLPSLTGSIDRIDFYVYTNSTYFNSGGTAIFNILHSGTDNPESSFEAMKIEADGPVGGYPKPGPKTITLPSGWYTPFLSAASPRAGWVSVGNSDTTNETYYCRFDGPSARLRIWFTQ